MLPTLDRRHFIGLTVGAGATVVVVVSGDLAAAKECDSCIVVDKIRHTAKVGPARRILTRERIIIDFFFV